jgi:hypothetical protein
MNIKNQKSFIDSLNEEMAQDGESDLEFEKEKKKPVTTMFRNHLSRIAAGIIVFSNIK